MYHIRVTARNSRPVKPATPPFRSVAFMLTSLGYTISRRFQQALEPLKLEPGEFALLRAVAADEGEPQNALAERLHISPSWMVAIVDELESGGLVERRPHPRDRRVRTLHLTAVGKSLLRRAEQHAERFDRRVTNPLSEAELRQLLDLLERVATGLELQPGAHAALREQR
jgi:DNA-binding MarR family transcriptional regulator